MSGLFQNLYSVSNALRAHTSALDVTGRNLANVDNPSYARQRVVYGDRGSVATALGAQSLGLEAVGLQQFRDQLLDGQIRVESGGQRSWEVQLEVLRQAQTALGGGALDTTGGIDTIGGNPAAVTGLAPALDAFFNAWETFSADPSSVTGRQQLIAATDDLIAGLRVADRRLAELSLPSTQNTITDRMEAAAESVNGLLATIADLNRQIGRAELTRPGTAVDLRDQRAARLEELARYLDFTAVNQSNGQVAVQVRDTDGNAVNLVDLATVTGTLARSGAGFTWTPTSGPASTLAIGAGELHGLVAAGTAVADYRASLDQFVATLVDRVNTAYGASINGDFFAAAGTTAATIARTATATTLRADDIGQPAGANSRALAVAAIARDASFLEGTPAATFGRLVARVGQDIATGTNRREDQDSLLRVLQAQRDSYGGVNMDEEVAHMMRLQRAFEASARLMQVMDEMLERVVNGLMR